MRIYERINTGDTKVDKEEGGGSVPSTQAEIPLQPVVKTMVRQLCLSSPRRVHGGANTMDAPPWSSLFLKDCILWEGPTWAIHEDLQLVGRTHMGEVH